MDKKNSLEAEGHCGIVAVIGRANVGKSTLLNRILEEKVSIVSPVPQTTRNMVRAILTEPRGQLVFLDTPGVHKAKYELNRLMNKFARTAVPGADVALLVLDRSQRPLEEDEGWMRRLCREEAQPVFVLNKSDLPASYEDEYLRLWQNVAQEKNSDRQPLWYHADAVGGDGLEEILAELFSIMPLSPRLFPEDILTDFPRNLMIADVIREKFFSELRDELPHSLAVEVKNITEQQNSWRIEIDIIVKRSTQKGIVIGRKGKLLKKVKNRAEQDLAEIYGRKIVLEPWVKIDPKWDRNYWILKKLGYCN